MFDNLQKQPVLHRSEHDYQRKEDKHVTFIISKDDPEEAKAKVENVSPLLDTVVFHHFYFRFTDEIKDNLRKSLLTKRKVIVLQGTQTVF